MTEVHENHTVTIGITADGEDINPGIIRTRGYDYWKYPFPELNGSMMDIHALTGSTQKSTPL